MTHDAIGNLWVGGSVWFLQGLLLRINSSGVKVMTPRHTQTIQRLVFTGKRSAWMIADNRHLYRSIDTGRTWRRVLTAHSNLEDIAFAGERFGWVVGWHGIIYYTDNGGKTWNEQKSGTAVDLKQVAFIDNTHGWAMGWNMLDLKTQTWPPALLRTVDGGKTWEDLSQTSLSLRSLAFLNRQQGWGINANNNRTLIHTDDGGLTWKTKQVLTVTSFEYVFFQNERDGWAVGNAIVHTADGGQTWEYQRLPKKNLNFTRISFAGSMTGGPIRTGAMDTSRDGDIVRTRDGGRHWKVISNGWVRQTTARIYREKFRG